MHSGQLQWLPPSQPLFGPDKAVQLRSCCHVVMPCVLQVIEMTQVTPASDIWSVGCLIIELLTGYPPYYDLQPMSALFRIVQVGSSQLMLLPEQRYNLPGSDTH